MAGSTPNLKTLFLKFLPFWAFLIFYKLGGALHYSLIAPLGERVLPLWVVGLLMGGGSVIQLLLDVPAGHLLDRFGYRRLLKLTTFLFLFAGIALWFDFTAPIYLVSLIMATLGWLFFGPGVSAYVLSQAPANAAGRFMSFRDVAGSFGVVLASAILGIVLSLNTQMIGGIIFAMMVLALIAVSFAPPDRPLEHTQPKLPTQQYYIRRHFIHQTLGVLTKLQPASIMLLLVGLVGAIFYGIIWFVVPLVIAHQINSGFLSIGLGVFDFSIVVLGFLLGNWADRGNKRALVFFGLLLFSVAGVFLGFNFGWLFLIFGFLATTGDEMASIALWSWLHHFDRDHAHDGLIAGVITLFEDLGWAIGPMVAGVLYGLVGPSWTIAFGACLIGIVWAVYQLFFARHHRSVPVHNIPPRPHRRRHRR